MRKEYQVYFKGQYLSTIFADSDEEAKIEIASKLEITNIPISEINSETSPNEDTTIPPKKATSKSCFDCIKFNHCLKIEEYKGKGCKEYSLH